MYRNECEEKCNQLEGNLDTVTYACYVTKYLNDICIRVKKRDSDSWTLDDTQS